MSAITPHLEVQSDPTETAAEEEYFNFLKPGRGGLGQIPSGAEAIESRVLDQSHAGLTRMAWTRLPTLDVLAGGHYEVLTRKLHGHMDVYIHTDEPSGFDPAWNPPGAGNIRNTSLLSWTSKMGCPSFSLPAGSPIMAGTCPGADAGQSVVPDDKLFSGEERVFEITARRVRLSATVCQHCYAEGGNYAYGSNTRHQVIRHLWTQQALDNGSFVPTMIYAIDNANYLLDGGRHPDQDKGAGEYAHERHQGRYFRIHDSGDFFSREYLGAWKQIYEALPEITFWAPTRAWATDWGIDAVNRVNAGGHRNFIIRPSIYHVNEPHPDVLLGPGWADWSVVFKDRVKPTKGPMIEAGYPYHWDCQAYAVNSEKHSCRNALAPDRKIGCRACWVTPKLSVNYTFH
jgi:hypothetical protein